MSLLKYENIKRNKAYKIKCKKTKYDENTFNM